MYKKMKEIYSKTQTTFKNENDQGALKLRNPKEVMCIKANESLANCPEIDINGYKLVRKLRYFLWR